MPTWLFTINLAGIEPLAVDHDSLLSRHGAPDAMISTSGGVTSVAFCRDADVPFAAVREAAASLTAAVPEAAILGLDAELVGISEIAAEAGVTREAVRQYADGTIGPGGFPPPAGVIGKGQRAWYWADVEAWLRTHGLGALDAGRPVPRSVATRFDADVVDGKALAG